jgi:hypothetical protein
VNNAICTATGDQTSMVIASDDSGGAIITWTDKRSGGVYNDIYTQRISASGEIRWTPNGVPICTALYSQNSPAILSDDSGGAIIAWHDYRNENDNNIYAQRISADGAIKWTPNGVPICTTANGQNYPSLVSDGNGGAIIAWYDYLGGSYWNISAQRISADGVTQWTPNGVFISTAAINQTSPNMISDGNGGAIIACWDNRGTNPFNVYAQRVNAGGATQWTPNGISICRATLITGQGTPNIVSDGSGGAIITWMENNSGSYYIYVQRINSDSTFKWTARGVNIYSAINQLTSPKLVSDDSGGAIIIWNDARRGYSDIYAQRINEDSALQWDPSCVAACLQTGDQLNPNIIKDGSGGAIIAWRDSRSGDNVYAQNISAGGALQWTTDGAAICTIAGAHYFPVLVSDNSGGAIITWWEYRSIDADIYAQRVYNSGNLFTSVKDGSGGVPNAFRLAQNYPNPFNPATTIGFTLAKNSNVMLKVYDLLGREIATLVNEEMKAGILHKVSFDGSRFASGIYFYRLEAGENAQVKKLILLK